VPIRAADPRLTVRAGVVVLLVAALAAVYLLFLRDRLFLGPSVQVHVYFQNVGALQEGAPVVVAGRQVGTVGAIRLVPRESIGPDHPLAGTGGVEAIARIQRRRRAWVPDNGDFFVSSRGVFSERYLEVGPPRDGSAPGAPARDGMAVVAAEPPALDRVWQTTWDNLQIARVFMEEVRPEAAALMDVLDELRATIAAVEPAPGAYEQLGARVAHLTSEARTAWLALEVGRARPEELAALVARTRGTLTRIGVATGLLRVSAATLAADLDRVTGQLDAARPGLEAKLRDALAAADQALAKIEGVSARVAELMGMIERGEGSLARLASDPEFPEDAKALGKILKRAPWRIIGRPPD
jgi:ABC-type transporter Mla subunit MlaD